MYCLVLLSALLACAAGVPLTSIKPRLDGRIVGGNETDITSHPYQVSVLYEDLYLCGGSIISPNWVLTDAGCVAWSSPDPIIVRSGSTYSNTGGTIHNATRIIVHEKYVISTDDYGVALVEVSPAFTFSASVQPITLECDPVPVGTDVVLTGWGPTTEGGPNSINLYEMTVQITKHSECNSTYAIFGGITDRMICAGDPNGDKGACWSDYGSPLVASNRQVGIYSWGLGCGLPQYPGIYINVSALCDWIVINAGL